MRCDALRLLSRQAHASGDFPAAVRLSREMLQACEALPEGLLVRPENETLPRLAVGTFDLAVSALAAGPDGLPEVRREIAVATGLCRSARERDPASFPLACGLARCLHAEALLALAAGDGENLRANFAEAAELLLAPPDNAERVAFSQVREISATATAWAETTLRGPDSELAADAVELAQRFTGYVQKYGIQRDDLVFQRARIQLFRSELAVRTGDRREAAGLAASAFALLRRRQAEQPNRISLALLTVAAMHQARSLAEFREARWSDGASDRLNRLLDQLEEKAEELTAEQRRELAKFR
jgi:hypothetical protein